MQPTGELDALLQVPTIAVELVEFEANTTVRCRAAAAGPCCFGCCSAGGTCVGLCDPMRCLLMLATWGCCCCVAAVAHRQAPGGRGGAHVAGQLPSAHCLNHTRPSTHPPILVLLGRCSMTSSWRTGWGWCRWSARGCTT